MFWERFSHLCDINNKKPHPLGKELGISSGVISTWKKEGYCPSGEMLIKISNYFDCSIDYLVGRTDNLKAQKFEFSDDEFDFINKLKSLPEESQDEILLLLNFKYEQFKKKETLSISENNIA